MLGTSICCDLNKALRCCLAASPAYKELPFQADNAPVRKLYPIRLIQVVTFALLQTLIPVALSAGSPSNSPVAIGQALPDVTMGGLNGPSRSLKAWNGRRLIINVWASWCGPCRAEAASLERFAWSGAGSKYTVIGISTDDDRKAAEHWLRQSNATLTHYIDQDLVLEQLLGASSIPLTVLVDERGRVVSRVRGAREWDTAESIQLIEREFKNSKASRRP